MPSFPVSRSTAFVLVGTLLAVLVVAGHRLSATGTATAPDAVAPLEPVTASAPARLVVHVVGAVSRPGLYRLREGSRVADAVARAGGATRKADLGGINLAAPLVDGAQVLVPARLPVATPGSPSSSAGDSFTSEATPGAGRKLSLATATAAQLDELPGVGPVTAQKILDFRAEHGFIRSVDDLDAVPGIGPARIEQLRELVTP